MSRGFQTVALVVCLAFAHSASAKCGPDVFFDAFGSEPLKAPNTELKNTIRLAKAGNPTAQRNLAVSYEAGYLVSACPEKAAYWYGEAAIGNDPVAMKWMERKIELDKIGRGPSGIYLFGGSSKSRLADCLSVSQIENIYQQYGADNCTSAAVAVPLR